VVFTDGACEDYLDDRVPTVTCGAIVFFPDHRSPEFFGVSVVHSLVKEWQEEGKRQLVTEAELYPVLLTKMHWHLELAGKSVLFFTDSNPAKFCVIKGASTSQACTNIVRSIHGLNTQIQSKDWYTRVPTKSNPADSISRLDFNEAKNVYRAIQVEPIQPTSLKLPLELLNKDIFQ
jgi:hypothetical protein